MADHRRSKRFVASDPVSRILRHLYLVDGKVERDRSSVDGELAIRFAAMDWDDRAGFHFLARLSRTICRAGADELCGYGGCNVASGVFCVLHRGNYGRFIS